MRELFPRTMYGGSPPTDLNARTGESTPPGITRQARACSSCDFVRCFIWTLEYTAMKSSRTTKEAVDAYLPWVALCPFGVGAFAAPCRSLPLAAWRALCQNRLVRKHGGTNETLSTHNFHPANIRRSFRTRRAHPQQPGDEFPVAGDARVLCESCGGC